MQGRALFRRDHPSCRRLMRRSPRAVRCGRWGAGSGRGAGGRCRRQTLRRRLCDGPWSMSMSRFGYSHGALMPCPHRHTRPRRWERYCEYPRSSIAHNVLTFCRWMLLQIAVVLAESDPTTIPPSVCRPFGECEPCPPDAVSLRDYIQPLMRTLMPSPVARALLPAVWQSTPHALLPWPYNNVYRTHTIVAPIPHVYPFSVADPRGDPSMAVLWPDRRSRAG